MSIDYSVWGHHTLAEVRYGNHEYAMHVRVPVKEVINARRLFTVNDLEPYDPHIDFTSQPYQLHIFDAMNRDTFINNVPYEQVLPLLSYLNRNHKLRRGLLGENQTTEFADFSQGHELPEKPGLVWLFAGYEKYGTYDYIVSEPIFWQKQLHRVALYFSFLDHLGYSEITTEDALPYPFRGGGSVEEKLESAAASQETRGGFTLVSINASSTMIIEGGNERMDKYDLRHVCDNPSHPEPVYWARFKDRMFYRIVDPKHEDAPKINRQLADIEPGECPKCSGSNL